MRCFEATSIEMPVETRPFGERDPKSLPQPVLMASSSELP